MAVLIKSLHEVLKGFLKVTEELQVVLALREDGLVLIEHELHYLALEHHVNRHVGRLGLRPKQRGSEHDGNALNRHSVMLLVLDHPAQVFEQQLHGVVVGQRQSPDQVLHVGDSESVV